jgi:hypothetical protein
MLATTEMIIYVLYDWNCHLGMYPKIRDLCVKQRLVGPDRFYFGNMVGLMRLISAV